MSGRLMILGDVGSVSLTLQQDGRIRIETGFDAVTLNLIIDKVKQQLVAQTMLGPGHAANGASAKPQQAT